MSASEKPLGDAAALPLGPSLRLVIVSASAFASYELPIRGDVTIGRSEKSDLRIDDATITRRHAILRVGDRIEIEDLGSVNGTRVREQRLRPGQRAQIFVGDTFHLGSALVMVQAAHPPTPERGAADDIVTRRAELAGDSARRRVEHDPPIIQDPSMRELYAYVDRLALGAIAVLVVGETGVGKELVAERLHESSPRRGKPFLRLNCAAFAESLLESELFGYERGAFTGAQQAKAGLLESADGGTVLLDEVGEMSLSVQAKLLRVLEAKQTTRVGALLARSVDVRIVAATNRSLSEDIEAGRFRRDLYFRLNGAVVTVPPLRERAGDIEPLAREFMARACRDLARPIPTLSEAALQLLMRHLWPGTCASSGTSSNAPSWSRAAPSSSPSIFRSDKWRRRSRSIDGTSGPARRAQETTPNARAS